MPPTSSPDDLRLTGSAPGAAFWGLTSPGTRVPDEIPPPVSVASERFVSRVEHLDPDKRSGEGLTRVSEAIVGLLERCRPDAERSDLAEEALLIEASAASTDEILSSVGRHEYLPTDHGDLIVLDYSAFTPVLSRDVGNPRTVLRLGMSDTSGYSYVAPVISEYDARGLRTVEFRNTEHYRDLHRAHREALGFRGMVRDHRDRLDLERGARLGILKPGVASTVRLVDLSTGQSGIQLVLVDANRRLTFSERIHDAVMPAFNFGQISRYHFFDGDGLSFRTFTPADAHEIREALADAYAFADGPAPTGDPDVDRRDLELWAENLDKDHPDWAAIVRTRVMRIRLILGVDQRSALSAVNPVTVAIGAYRDQLHLRDLADLGWDKNAQEATVGQELLRRSRETASVVPFGVGWQDTVLFDPTSLSWRAPDVVSTHDPAVAARAAGVEIGQVVESAQGIAALTGDLVPAVVAVESPEWNPNVLDLILATTATIVCRAQPMTTVVKDVLGHHRLANNPKIRAEIATSVLLPALQLPAEGTETARASAALSRTLCHGTVYKLDDAFDPLGKGLKWVDLLDWSWFDIVDRAREEILSGRGVTPHGERRYGPAQTLLTLAAAICLEVSPAVVTSSPRDDAFPQLTLSGLGGQHGGSRAEPLAVLYPLATTDEGITQLWEAVVAAIGSEVPRPARSVRWDPERQHRKLNGDVDVRYWSAFLTEYDLRGETWGHASVGVGGQALTGGASPPVNYQGAAAYVGILFDDTAAQLERLADDVGSVADRDNMDRRDPALDPDADAFGGSATSAFFGDGVDPDVSDRIIEAADRLQRAATTGKVVRISLGGAN